MMNPIQQAILKQKVALLIQKNQQKEANAIVQQLLRETPNDIELLVSAAQICEFLNDNESAVRYYFRISTLNIPEQSKINFLEKSLHICKVFQLYKFGLVISNEIIKFKPNDLNTLFLCGFFNFQNKYILKSIEYFQKVLAIDIKNNPSKLYLALNYSQIGQAKTARDFFREHIEVNTNNGVSEPQSLYCFNFEDDVNETTISNAHKAYGQYLENISSPSQFTATKRNPKIRIGYVSACFYWHSIGYFFKAALEGTSRSDFDIYCYSDTKQTDDMTELLMSKSDHWSDTKSLSNDELSQQILNDSIDILVDLSGYTKGSRMGMFSQKPAPIQVAYLGYPNTTGLSRIDYRIVDRWSDTKESDKFYAEKLVRLPSGFLCFFPDKDAPTVSDAPSLENETICFGSFNTFSKITDQVINLWSKVLGETKNSRLLIKAGPLHDEQFCQWVWKRFESNNIPRESVELIGWTEDTASHLQLYSLVDIHLDTFPYNGTTTTCEALWQGVPTITLAGAHHRERVSMSILSQVGLEEFIAYSEKEYIAIAVKTANNRKALHTLRTEMRVKMQQSYLMDVELFSSELADAYKLMFTNFLDEK